ncbi:Predicted lipoprotein with conserved Yx(FWY)xxD motif [Actinacidiphila alni]|uniref:Predicted lipoprotein with conserved Yx(FWY)xxD motif n=1 Tax=Actinacidiphila alni TaxID=380248 RepID=A0A1I2IYD4_9ACTN|nr:hypothetical protein [Actinacidiphila alni]SFF47304.1 Predicted lipoprotein with conserved Yx(FWY)xxD motif [Actinacidiphila alni]
MRTRTALIAAPLASLALLTLSACGGDDGSKDSGDKAASNVSVKVADSDLGKVLVDQSGRTLYAFAKDKDNKSNCDAACIAVWPALTSHSATAGSGAAEKLLGKAEQTKGVEQVTYGQWPLYYYVGDAVPGDVNGQGMDGVWFAVGADGKLVKKDA